jgi:hypothetical protein
MLIDGKSGRSAGQIFVLAVAVVFAVMLALAGRASAQDLTLECLRADVFNPNWSAPATFAYKGGERGVLKVSGILGEFEIPTSRRPTHKNPDVMKESINAAATVRANLPALSDLEACMDKVPGALSASLESDAFLDTRDQCMRALPAAASGVDAMVQITLGISGKPGGADEDAFVVLKLIYNAASRAAGGGRRAARCSPRPFLRNAR